jgi:3-oxoacyl-[acyl-carrier protein] reductase
VRGSTHDAPPLPDRRRLGLDELRWHLVCRRVRPGSYRATSPGGSTTSVTVVATGWSPHDAEMPWGERTTRPAPVRGRPARPGGSGRSRGASSTRCRTARPRRHRRCRPRTVVHLARRGDRDELDRAGRRTCAAWCCSLSGSPTATSPSRRATSGRPMLWFTSGQHLGPMDGEIAYAVSKGAAPDDASIDHALSRSRSSRTASIPARSTPATRGSPTPPPRRCSPTGRWGTPDDIAERGQRSWSATRGRGSAARSSMSRAVSTGSADFRET